MVWRDIKAESARCGIKAEGSRIKTADDIERLGETVRARVTANGGPDLRWEIRRIGHSTTKEPCK